jgi:hypothetical protein
MNVMDCGRRFLASRVRQSEFLVASKIRLYLDALIAVALMAVVAVVCGFIAALIAAGRPPNFLVMAIAFLLTGGFLLLRLWLRLRAPLATRSEL